VVWKSTALESLAVVALNAAQTVPHPERLPARNSNNPNSLTTRQAIGRADLIAGVRRGAGEESYDLSKELIRKFPDDAANAIMYSCQHFPDGTHAQRMLSSLARLSSPGILSFLQAEASKGPNLQIRTRAIELLARSDPYGAKAAAFDLWSVRFHLPRAHGNIATTIRPIISSFGHPAPASDDLAEGFTDADTNAVLETMIFVSSPTWKPEPREAGEAEELEDVLVGELGRTTKRFNIPGLSRETSRDGNRICDYADKMLAKEFPGKYKVGDSRQFLGLDQDRTRNLNIWRTQHGLARLPLPTRRKVTRAQSLNVTSVIVNGTPPLGADNLVRRLQILSGKHLTKSAFLAFIEDAVGHWTKTIKGFALTAEREDYGGGVALTLAFPEDVGMSSPWMCCVQAAKANNLIANFTDVGFGQTPGGRFGPLGNALNKVLSLKPYEAFSVSYGISTAGFLA